MIFEPAPRPATIRPSGAGDLSRRAVGEDPNGGINPVFASLNRNKRSVALDLKSVEDRAAVPRLVERSDDRRRRR